MSVSDVRLSWTTMGGLCKVCVLDGVLGRGEGSGVEWLQQKEELHKKGVAGQICQYDMLCT